MNSTCPVATYAITATEYVGIEERHVGPRRRAQSREVGDEVVPQVNHLGDRAGSVVAFQVAAAVDVQSFRRHPGCRCRPHRGCSTDRWPSTSNPAGTARTSKDSSSGRKHLRAFLKLRLRLATIQENDCDAMTGLLVRKTEKRGPVAAATVTCEDAHELDPVACPLRPKPFTKKLRLAAQKNVSRR